MALNIGQSNAIPTERTDRDFPRMYSVIHLQHISTQLQLRLLKTSYYTHVHLLCPSTNKSDLRQTIRRLFYVFVLCIFLLFYQHFLSVVSYLDISLFVIPFVELQDKYYFISALYKLSISGHLQRLSVKMLCFFVVTGQCFKWFASATDGTLGRGGLQCNNMSSEG